jgi:hypothetical protein
MTKKNHPPIFVVGTGRSGTTILYKSLGCHPAVHTFPREMRFLIDPGGLSDLIDGLTTRYHPVQAREAIYHFERLMRVYLAEPAREPFRGFKMPAWIGEPHYTNRLDQFIAGIVDREFEGFAWQIEPQNDGRLMEIAKQATEVRQKLFGTHQAPFRLTLPRPTLKVGKYFSDRSQLVALARNYVDDLFRHAAHQHGKQTWSEKTPQHLLNLDFIWELFPDSYVIHIKRDPRGVAQSMTQQFWAPSDLADACHFMRPIYQRWADMRQRLDFTGRCYLEMKLEDFAIAPEKTLAQVADFCGLPNNFVNPPKIDANKVNYWRQEMTEDELALATGILEEDILDMGYEI